MTATPGGDPHFTDERLAAALLRSTADSIVASDREGIIRFWSRGAERLFGHSAPDAVGQSLNLIIPERLRARHWHGYHQAIATGRSRYAAGDVLSVPALHKDGSTISVEFTITTMRSEQGEISGLIAVIRDVTARFNEIKALKEKLWALTGGSG